MTAQGFIGDSSLLCQVFSCDGEICKMHEQLEIKRDRAASLLMLLELCHLRA